MMSGKERLDKQLDDLNKSLKLGVNKAPMHGLDKFLVPRGEMAGYDGETCLHIAAEIMQYGIFLQRAQNREMARLKMHESRISSICASEWGMANFPDYMNKESKPYYLAINNIALKTALSDRDTTQSNVDELFQLSNMLYRYAEIYKEMARVK